MTSLPPPAAPSVTVDLWADVVCPWCAIGRHRMTQAVEAFEASTQAVVQVRWRAFELHPHWPARGLSWTEFATQRWGSPTAARRVFARVEQVAAADGLVFDFARIARVPRTRDAHRLILRAQQDGPPWQVVDVLADGYFTGQADLTDRDRLAELIASVTEESAQEVWRFLDGDGQETEVLADAAGSSALGISGVPFFVITGTDGSHTHVSGAQPVQVLLQALARAAVGEA